MTPPTAARAVTLIAIEASSQRCSAALAHRGQICALASDSDHRHAESVPELVGRLLVMAAVPLATVDAFAFAAGPGGFTGLRVACAFAQGLAFGCERPLIAVSSLRALAHATGAGFGDRVLAAIDARMGQVYWCVFESTESGPRALAAAAVADPCELADIVRRWRPDVIAGDALQAYAAAWPQPGSARLDAAVRVDASAIAALAVLDWSNGLAVEARDAAPEYVRDRVALTVEERRAPGSVARETSR